MKPAAGIVKRAWLDLTRIRPPLTRGADSVKTAGLAYERKVFCKLAEWFPGATIAHNPVLQFETKWSHTLAALGARYCIPDVLVLDADRVVTVEVKTVQAVGRASQELRELYGPVVRALLPNAVHHLLEIARLPDPDRTQRVLKDPREVFTLSSIEVGFWPYSGRF